MSDDLNKILSDDAAPMNARHSAAAIRIGDADDEDENANKDDDDDDLDYNADIVSLFSKNENRFLSDLLQVVSI